MAFDFKKEYKDTDLSFNNTKYSGYHVVSYTIYRVSFNINKRHLICLSDK